MVAVDDCVAGVEFVDGGMGEGVFGEFSATGFDGRLMGDLAERHDGAGAGQGGQRSAKIRPAGADFFGRGLVAGGRAADCIGDEDASWLQRGRFVGAGGRHAFGKAGLDEGFMEQRTGRIAGEWNAGAVGATDTGGEAQDKQPWVRITPAMNRRIVPIGVARAIFLPVGDEPWAERAIDGRFGGLHG